MADLNNENICNSQTGQDQVSRGVRQLRQYRTLTRGMRIKPLTKGTRTRVIKLEHSPGEYEWLGPYAISWPLMHTILNSNLCIKHIHYLFLDIFLDKPDTDASAVTWANQQTSCNMANETMIRALYVAGPRTRCF